MEEPEKLQHMLNHMSPEGIHRAYVIIQRLWLRYGTSARNTHKASSVVVQKNGGRR